MATSLVRIAGEGVEVPDGFVGRVMARLPRREHAADTDLWRPAWGLIPAFTAAAIALLFVYQTSFTAPSGLMPIEQLSAGEQLVLQGPAPGPDQVLGVVLGEGAP